MNRISRRSRRFAVLAMLAASAAVVGPLSSAAIAAPGSTHAHATGQIRGEVVRYWTHKRMRQAKPIKLPHLTSAQARALSPAGPEGPPVIIPGRPPAGVPGTRATGTDSETLPANDTTYPQRTHGKLYVTLPNGGKATCSATVVDSPYGNLLLTAAHCLYRVGSGYSTNVAFRPSLRNGVNPYGLWTASTVLVSDAWKNGTGTNGSFANDFGAVIVSPKGATIEATVGGRGVAFNLSATNNWRIFGYPGHPNSTEDNGFNHTVGDYNAERLIYCDAATVGSDFPSTTAVKPCYMQEGASGGGWILAGTNALNGLVSFGDSRCTTTNYTYCGRISSPYFGSAAQAFYNTAVAAGAPPPPPPRPPAATGQRAAALKKCKKKHSKKTRKKCKKKANKLPL